MQFMYYIIDFYLLYPLKIGHNYDGWFITHVHNFFHFLSMKSVNNRESLSQ